MLLVEIICCLHSTWPSLRVRGHLAIWPFDCCLQRYEGKKYWRGEQSAPTSVHKARKKLCSSCSACLSSKNLSESVIVFMFKRRYRIQYIYNIISFHRYHIVALSSVALPPNTLSRCSFMPCLPSASNALRIESVAFAKPFPTKAKSDMAIWIHLATPFGGIWEHQCYLGSHGQKKCKSFKRFQRHDKPSQFCDVSPPPPYSELPWKVNGERNWRNRKLWKTGTKNCVPSGPDT